MHARDPVRSVEYAVSQTRTLFRPSVVAMSSQMQADKEATAVVSGGKVETEAHAKQKRNCAYSFGEGVRLALLYDGDCPLCMKEVNMLRSRSDARGGTLHFVDIAADDYESEACGIDYETAMGRIHAIRPDGTIIQGVEVFREAYEAVGLGWVYSVTKIPGALWLADKVYDVWADKRLEWTGRGSLEAVLSARNDKRTCR